MTTIKLQGADLGVQHAESRCHHFQGLSTTLNHFQPRPNEPRQASAEYSVCKRNTARACVDCNRKRATGQGGGWTGWTGWTGLTLTPRYALWKRSPQPPSFAWACMQAAAANQIPRCISVVEYEDELLLVCVPVCPPSCESLPPLPQAPHLASGKNAMSLASLQTLSPWGPDGHHWPIGLVITWPLGEIH